MLMQIALTNDTPYIALTGELWCVFRELKNTSRGIANSSGKNDNDAYTGNNWHWIL